MKGLQVVPSLFSQRQVGICWLFSGYFEKINNSKFFVSKHIFIFMICIYTHTTAYNRKMM